MTPDNPLQHKPSAARKALVLGGKTGLLGQALAHVLKEQHWDLLCPGRDDLDVFDQTSLEAYIERHRPSHLFNTIGYTQVDQAEEETRAASRLNTSLPILLARIAKSCNLYFIHYSTDFVFDGKKSIPYLPQDEPNPLSVYGTTKLEGEQGVMALGWDKTLIIRTAWLFGPYKTNFVDKILTLAATRRSLDIVHDQVGCPTYTMDLACNTLALVKAGAQGIFHLTNTGHASWCELAAEAIACTGVPCHARPISSADFPQKAVRPAYSVLDCSDFVRATGLTPRPWIQALRAYLFEKDHACLTDPRD
ncbi:dTDP-4-dehydrorhamnose reductase [Desulfoplanes formicivorans]|uniref:dTDP-4-dehydrorhamnose reductase n=1 Tax=Desulfoplanes formicivorans TaxID=1592317 RepID=A0A194AHA1_9BACT|nr:dTDP-4-dehydrorhamnose reductase [Desulfoplanes formicivorans]GAU08708.1 dTDP-4-dehydrorhamnose reductase [Desulfoplanes formicivorans]